MQNGVLKFFVNFSLQHLCRSLLFNKTVGYLARTPVLWNITGRLLLPDILLKNYSENFWKIFEKFPRKLQWKSLVLIMMETLDLETFLKRNHKVLKNDLCSLYAENYLINRNSSQSQILRKLFRAWLIQMNIFYLCTKLFWFLGFNYWILHYNFFCFKKWTISRSLWNI